MQKKKFHLLVWLDNLSWPNLLITAVLLGISPIVPEPHLFEKLRMLFQGLLVKPIDIFDLLLHSFGLLLVIIKGIRQLRKQRLK